MTMYLLVGTPVKLRQWVANTSQDANFTSYIADYQSIYFVNTKNSGDISGIEGDSKAFQLRSLTLPDIYEHWLCFLVNATGTTVKTIQNIYFAGIITDISDTYETYINDEPVSVLELQISGFMKEFQRLLVEYALMVNKNTDSVVKSILNKYTDTLVRQATINNPGRMSYVRFVNRYADSCLKELAEVNNYEFRVKPVLSSSFAGCEVDFKAPAKSYAFTLDKALMKRLGYGSTKIVPNKSTMANIVTLPFSTKRAKEPQFEYQHTVSNETELKTTMTLSGVPMNIDLTHIARDDFSDGILDDQWLKNDINNPSPPEGYTSDDGFLIEGLYNDISGLHIFNASGQSPAYGDIGIIASPDEVLFEPQVKAAIRLKELNINTLGDAIICAYLDPECTDTSELFDKNKIIFGLELKANGTMYVVENGVSTLISGKTYTADNYTIRNSCVVYETYSTAQTTSNIITVNDNSKFNVNNIIEIYRDGRDKDPVVAKVTAKGTGTITITAAIGTIKAYTTIRTKPKMRLEINGGAYGEVSGPTWTKLADSTITIQKETSTIREVSAAIIFQKSLVATLKEAVIRQYPPVEVLCNGQELTCSVPDDSAEKDIQVFLEKFQNNYRLRFPSDTKTLWASGTKLEVRFDEQIKSDIRVYDLLSMIKVAEKRGNPILATDTPPIWFKKGGIEAPLEDEPENSLSFSEAYNLANKILQEWVQNDLQITQSNLNSRVDGQIKAGQYIRVDLDKYDIKEIPIQRVYAQWAGTDENNNPIFQYTIEAAIEDNINKLLKSFGQKSQRIKDDIDSDTKITNQSYTGAEIITISDSLVNYQNTPVGYIANSSGNWQDIRRIIIDYGT